MSHPKNFAKLLDCFRASHNSMFLFVEEHKESGSYSTKRRENCSEIDTTTSADNPESQQDMSLLRKQQEAMEREEMELTIKEAFRVFDKDDDGFLDGVEIYPFHV